MEKKAKARGDEELFKTFSIFVVVGYNYRHQNLTPVQDGDSGHKAIAARKRAEKNNFSLLALPSNSSDFLIMETLAAPVKREFYAERSTTKKAAMARFKQVVKGKNN